MARAGRKDVRSAWPHRHVVAAAAALYAALACVLYVPVLGAPFLYDDAKFLNAPLLRITSLAELGRIFTAPGQPRRVGLATFALSYLQAGTFSPTAVHAVSLVLHVACAVLLLVLLRMLARRQPDAARPSDGALVAGVAAWLVHPVQTQGVSYAWQRFTPLCAALFLASLTCAWRARDARGRARVGWAALAVAAAVLALGTKENAGMLPPFVGLVLLLFPARGAPPAEAGSHRNWAPLALAAAAVAAFAAIGALYLGPRAWQMIARDSIDRGFTPWQRTITEWRIVVYYLTLLVCPSPSRLRLDYDWPLSHGLFDPATTVLSLLLILAAVAAGLSQVRRRPLVALSVLWFFGNLIIESTFIPLDLVYEHRLYLPSMLPIAVGVAYLLDAIARPGARALAAAAIVTWLGAWSVQRNQAWRDPVAMWEDAARKSPGKARVHWNLGKAYFEKRDYDRARAATERALALDPGLTGALNNLAAIELAQGRLPEAQAVLERALSAEPHHVPALLNLGVVRLRLGHNAEAIAPLEQVLALDPDNESATAALVAARYNLGEYDEAVRLAQAGVARHPESARLKTFLDTAIAARDKAARPK